MTNHQHHRLIILGSGPAGYTAAVYAARANLDPVLITGLIQGGQLTTTTDVDNWPGDVEGLQGPDLMLRMKSHAERFDTNVIFDHINSVDLKQRPFLLKGDNASYSCDALIIATGASAQYLGLDSEQAFMGKGVSACATCDGFFYRDKPVAVIGGGNTAVEEALFLTKFAKEVILIHRRDQLRAEKILQKRAFSNKKISFLWNSVVVDINGNETPKLVKSISVKSLKDNTSSVLDVDGIFVAIGHKPNTDLFINKLELDDEGYLKVNNQVFTNKKGVFAAGDVHDKTFRQAVTAAGFGCMAALEAEKFIESKK